jgi:tetratricopeptide (TPR) repeat protein
VSWERALIFARERPYDQAVLSDLARAALGEGGEEIALPLLRSAAERSQNASLWQWTALLERSLDEHERSMACFDRAAALAPADRSIAHGRARVTLEAGLPAGELYEEARRLSPDDGDVLLGYAASLFADGRSQSAEIAMEYALAHSPLWVQGHLKLAQLRSRIGKKEQATTSVERAIQLHPRQQQLWVALFSLLFQTEQFEALDHAVARARRHLQRSDTLLYHEAIAAVERGDTVRADRLFAGMGKELRRSLQIYWIRHLLRSGRVAEACESVDAALMTELRPIVWPYAAVAWRLAGDPRWQWIEGDFDRLISVVDLTAELRDMEVLEQTLRELHSERGQYLDQSVRGGSQTDGPLLSNVDVSIRALRAAIVPAVERYVQSLPPRDLAHPLLASPRGGRTRFSGSWSVLLQGSGYHTNHVHPQGWISSALYIRVPDLTLGDSKNAGWLTLGEPQAELGLGLNAFKEIEPKSGRLVLFPSYMWHGTRPFTAGERLSVAFDVKQPI